MLSILSPLLLVLPLLQLTSTHPTQTPSNSTTTPTFQTISSLPSTWFENLLILPSNLALTSLLSSPTLTLVSTTSSFPPLTLASIPATQGCLGIIEYAENKYAVACGNFSLATGVSTPGSYSVWSIELPKIGKGGDCGIQQAKEIKQAIKISKIADVKEAGFLNGVTIHPSTHDLLIADSLLGLIWSLNPFTGKYSLWMKKEEMAPLLGTGGLELGINGVKVWGKWIYFTNTNEGTINRVLLKGGEVERLGKGTREGLLIDDFTVGKEGELWVVSGSGELGYLDGKPGDKELTIVAKNHSPGFTAVAFGKSKEDLKRGSLYVTSSGGGTQWQTGVFTEEGEVLRLDTRGVRV